MSMGLEIVFRKVDFGKRTRGRSPPEIALGIEPSALDHPLDPAVEFEMPKSRRKRGRKTDLLPDVAERADRALGKSSAQGVRRQRFPIAEGLEYPVSDTLELAWRQLDFLVVALPGGLRQTVGEPQRPGDFRPGTRYMQPRTEGTTWIR